MKLTGKARKALPKKDFAEPKTKKYPIPDAAHARNALARVSYFGTATEKATVKKAVKKRFPKIKQKGNKK